MDYMRELAVLCVWDPAEEGFEPYVHIDNVSINKLTARFLDEQGVGYDYDHVRTVAVILNILLIGGKLSTDDYINLYDKEYKPFPSHYTDARLVSEELTEILDNIAKEYING